MIQPENDLKMLHNQEFLMPSMSALDEAEKLGDYQFQRALAVSAADISDQPETPSKTA